MTCVTLPPLVSRQAWIAAYVKLNTLTNIAAAMVGECADDIGMLPEDLREQVLLFDAVAERLAEMTKRELLALESSRDWP